LQWRTPSCSNNNKQRGRERKRSRGDNGTHLPIAMMTYKEGKKERPQKGEKENEIENYDGHHHNIFFSHLERKKQIGPCQF